MATSDKYDRQLRLWGTNGQRALMQSHILLIGADAAGTETLKNLVLPGVGKFTILDDAIVKAEECSSNFFVSLDSIGKSRAQTCTEFLCEMNSDVQGTYLIQNIEQTLQDDPNFLSSFSLVITSNLHMSSCYLVSSRCWAQAIPLVVVRTYGLIAYCRVQVKEHDIIESKSDALKHDLRLNQPFPELVEHSLSFDLKEQAKIDHVHTPFIVILIQALSIWKQRNDGRLPKTAQEKDAFKNIIKKELCQCFQESPENFVEAIKESYRCFQSTNIPDNLEIIYGLTSKTSLASDSLPFKFLVSALNSFIKQYGECPLNGSLPDMKSSTDYFVSLQQVYQNKSQADFTKFRNILDELLQSFELDPSFIADDVVSTFCKNISSLVFMQARCSLAESNVNPNTEVINEILSEPYDDPQQTPLLFYLALLAADDFYCYHGRYPGCPSPNSSEYPDQTEEAEKLWGILKQIGARFNVPSNSTESELAELTVKHATEITRSQAQVLHNIAAIIGGVASQEAIKLVTHQYTVINNTFIYNGIAGCGATYEI